MGRIDVSYDVVKQKNSEIIKKIQNKLDEDIFIKYQNLEKSISQSGGESVESIREELHREKEALLHMRSFMMDLILLIQDSSEAFEQIDIKHERNLNNLS